MKMTIIQLCCLVILFPWLNSGQTLQWSDCRENSDSPVSITHIGMEPYPITLPGTTRLSFVANSNRSIGTSAIDVKIWKNTWLGEIKVPCIMGVGSCRYPDSCNLIKRVMRSNDLGIQIKQMILDQEVNPLLCPIPPINLRIQQYPLSLPNLPSVLAGFAHGNYRSQIRFTEHSSGVELVCLNIEFRLKRKSSGWWFR